MVRRRANRKTELGKVGILDLSRSHCQGDDIGVRMGSHAVHDHKLAVSVE